ncbi:hypothetical protein HEK616_32790 [Streptomyces nigrescens]|uniref:Uncharacterized protein n=1 Tax=Streptomyces nigrescens TaxID=1920 RepID=A0ABN6QWM2_STRNI|nr:hypothetical protein HEK616_32790 [Streptomyces nigrescens]
MQPANVTAFAKCMGDCVENFIDGMKKSDVGVVERADGNLQVTIGGWPVHRFNKLPRAWPAKAIGCDNAIPSVFFSRPWSEFRPWHATDHRGRLAPAPSRTGEAGARCVIAWIRPVRAGWGRSSARRGPPAKRGPRGRARCGGRPR